MKAPAKLKFNFDEMELQEFILVTHPGKKHDTEYIRRDLVKEIISRYLENDFLEKALTIDEIINNIISEDD